MIGEGSGASSSSSQGALVTPGSPVETEQLQAQADVRLSSPDAVAVREASRTRFESLSARRSAKLAKEVFPYVIEHPAGGPPQMPAGESITGYLSDNAASLNLGDGKRGVLESFEPIAVQAAPGRRVPIDLGLRDAGRAFEPTTPAVAVSIRKRLGDGVSLSDVGVSLTPVDGRGAPLGGAEGVVDGAAVFYANTQTDTDTAIKPSTDGFAINTLLRSINSPEQLSFRVGMPRSASLVGPKKGTGAVEIMDEGTPLADVVAPSAWDAAGTRVPVSMTTSGNVVTVTVDHRAGGYQYPIEVDPEVIDSQITAPTRWKFGPEGVAHFKFLGYKSWLEIESSGEYSATEHAFLTYQTQGESHIYYASAGLKVQNEGNVEAVLELVHEKEGKEEAEEKTLVAAEHSEVYEKKTFWVCAEHPVYPSCPLEGTWKEYGAPHNQVKLQESATATGSGYNHANIEEAKVWIAQTHGPEQPVFNTSEEYLKGDENRRNVLYGSGGWLGPYSGGFEVKAKDPGVGVSKLYIHDPSYWSKAYEYLKEGLCEGVQCRPEVSQFFTYIKELPNGEDTVDVESEDATVSLSPEAHAVIKVDNTAPYGFKLKGLAESGAEISAAQHEISVEATEGTKPTVSSGIKSITATVDGKEIPTIGAPAYCSPGECKASGKWTIDAESLGAGVHQLVVTATSNAGTEAKKEYTFAIRNATPLAVGPGTVDPVSGQFALSATDVSLSGVGGLARNYRSRELTAGVEGPFGPQWSLTLGSGQRLGILPNGDALLVDASGGLTTFLHKENGEFDSPLGDGNLKLTFEPKEHVHLLTDAAQGTTMKFTQEGLENTTPVYATNFGAEGGDLVRPVSDAVDSSGNIWVTDQSNDRIAKFSSAGALLATYGSYGAEAGQLKGPWGISVNKTTGNVYVADQGNYRIEEFSSSGTFVKAMGWGVSNGKSEYEICTSSCKAGIAGAGNGQFSTLAGVTVDSSGDIWVVDNGNDRIQEFNEKGEYVQKFGSEGAGDLQFKSPLNVALSGANVYVTDDGNSRVQEISSSGVFVKVMGWGVSNGKSEYEICTSSCKAGIAGSGSGEFNGPSGLAADPATGNLYVSELINDRVQELTAAGTFVTKFGSSGSATGQFAQAMGVATSASGELYVTDYENARVQQWMRPTWLGTIAEGPAASDTQTIQYKGITTEGKTVIEPTEELGPKASGISCSPEPAKSEKGCRELTFKYAEKTKEHIGESPSEWGEYAGRLAKVLFTAYNPATGKMTVETPVAEYSYDLQGRLRAEWDPRITPALKTTYGYDAEGHVTAVDSPGQQPWLIHYGTIAGEASSGRLLSVIRPSASTALASGEAPKNTVAPTLSSTTPAVGTKISVSSNGTWSNSPLTYSYQWEDCNSAVKECTAIPGAVNQAYYPAKSDEGHTLIAEVSALNATGLVTASSAATSVVASGTVNNPLPEPPSSGTTSVWTVDYQVPISGTGAPYEMGSTKVAEWGQTDEPYEATAIFPPDEPMGWPAKDYKRASISYRDAQARPVNTASPTGGISTTEYNEANEVTRTLTADNRAEALKKGCKSEKECESASESKRLDTENTYNGEHTELVSTLGPQHTVRLATNETTVLGRSFARYFYDENAPEGGTYHLVTKTESGGMTATKEEFDVRTTTMSYGGQANLGWTLRKPTSVTTDPKGLKLTHTTEYEAATGDVIETRTPEGGAGGMSGVPGYISAFGRRGEGNGELETPYGVTVDHKGNVWVSNFLGGPPNSVEEFSPEGGYIKHIGPKSGESGYLGAPEGIAVSESGDVYVADAEKKHIEVYSEGGEYLKQIGTPGKEPGQLEIPYGIALDAKGDLWVVDWGNDRVVEYGPSGEYLQEVGSLGEGNAQFNGPREIAIDSEGNIWVTDAGNNRVEEFNSKGGYLRAFGQKGTGPGEFNKPDGIAASKQGTISVVDEGNSRIEQFNDEGKFVRSLGSHGSGAAQFEQPSGIAVNSAGQLYITETEAPERVAIWGEATASAHDAQVIYYSAESNSKYPSCGGHPEWVNLVCQTQPAAQPEGTGPKLPVDTMSYNVWDAPEVTTETFGSTTRTKKQAYDAAGRETASEVTSSIDTALPKVTDEYNEKTGALEKQSATIKGNTKTTTSKDNTLGQLVEYTDAEGNVAKYVYEEGDDERLEEVSEGKGTEADSKQTYTYDPTSGFMTKLVDSAAGTFTGTYDVEGKMLTEGYPNGMNANYVYDPTGAATSVEYVKMTHCTEKCVWFSDSIEASVHGETLSQKSSLSEEPEYVYDAAGRLTEVQEIPAGKGCKTRLYAYDEDSNRTSQTTREPGGEGKCATEGGTVESHTYDTADRLIDTGVAYETFGDITKLPGSDAGGNELTSTYYVDGQVASQEQKKEMIDYVYDPVGRSMETTSENQESKTKATAISHYSGPGEAPMWTSEEEGGVKKWTRQIVGIDGALDAIQSNGGTPVLQLHDLQGDIVATAALSETETKLLSTYSSTEFGVPNEGKAPPKYAWLGAGDVSSELTSSGTITSDGASYVPEIARSLQTCQATPPGADPNGSGPGAPYTTALAAESIALGDDLAAGAPARAAERQQVVQEEAERRAREAAEVAGALPPGSAGEEEDPEGIMTGKEAAKWASELAKNALLVSGYLAAGYCGKGSGCEYWVEYLETDSELEGEASEKLYACSNEVRDGRRVTDRFGIPEYQNGVCYYHFTTRKLKALIGGMTVFSTFGPVEPCWSVELEAGVEWSCPGHGIREFGG